MDDKKQTMTTLLDLWRQVPELRFGQLLWNAADLYFRSIGRPRTDQNIGEYLFQVTDKRLAEIVALYVQRTQE